MSEQAIEIAAKMYEGRKLMKQLLGEVYKARVARTRKVIEGVMECHDLTVMEATHRCLKEIAEREPHGNGMMTAMILATAVEMIEEHDE